MPRRVYTIADDYGIGPETSRGILDVARAGRLTASVLIVNTPYVESALKAWEAARRPMALGWHPNLTLDRPLLPPEQVPSLVQPDGRFHKLGAFLQRAFLGRLNHQEVHAELTRQHERFCQLLGHPPRMVNSHQHVAIFEPARTALLAILKQQSGPPPYLRRVCEERRLIGSIAGARLKRLVLNHFGRKLSRQAAPLGLPGAEWLVGVTDPRFTADPHFYTRWLGQVRGDTVEIGCHPGYYDETLLVRDVPGKPHDLSRRVNELNMLLSPEFAAALEANGFELVPPDLFQSRWLAQAA